jgi:hypothetical protein
MRMRMRPDTVTEVALWLDQHVDRAGDLVYVSPGLSVPRFIREEGRGGSPTELFLYWDRYQAGVPRGDIEDHHLRVRHLMLPAPDQPDRFDTSPASVRKVLRARPAAPAGRRWAVLRDYPPDRPIAQALVEEGAKVVATVSALRGDPYDPQSGRLRPTPKGELARVLACRNLGPTCVVFELPTFEEAERNRGSGG